MKSNSKLRIAAIAGMLAMGVLAVVGAGRAVGQPNKSTAESRQS